jgi:hypothetical protein
MIKEILLVMFVFASTFFALKLRHGDKAEVMDYSSNVNRHIQATQIQIDHQNQSVLSDLESMELIINSYKKDPKEKNYLSEAELNEQLNPTKPKARASIAERIQQELFNQDFAVNYDDAYKRKYAEQFLENALRGGYEVRLDQNYKVLTVRKIRRNSNLGLFEGRSPQAYGSMVMYKPHKNRPRMLLKPSYVFKKTFPKSAQPPTVQ